MVLGGGAISYERGTPVIKFTRRPNQILLCPKQRTRQIYYGLNNAPVDDGRDGDGVDESALRTVPLVGQKA